MAEKTTIAKIYTDLVSAFGGIMPDERIFCGGRPNFLEQQYDSFIVIQLPIEIRDAAIGKHKLLLSTIGVVCLFCKEKKDTTLNVSSMSDMIEEVESLFPIRGAFCSASDPEYVMSGSDGYGYQVTQMSFKLHTTYLQNN